MSDRIESSGRAARRGGLFATVALAFAMLALPQSAAAQGSYPEAGKTYSIVVGASAGSGQDVTARLVADALEAKFPDSTFQVVNKPGAGTQLAYQEIADSPKDGSTFGIISLPNFVTLYLDESRQAQFDRGSFKPIANFIFDPGAIAVRAESPYQTLADLVEAAKAKPGEITVGVGSPRGREHLDVTALEQAAGVKFNPVFHNDSGAALNTLLGGNIDAQQGSVGDFLSQIDAGRLRLLAVFSPQPSGFAPDVPTAESAGYPISSGVSRGFTFPAGVPDEAVQVMSDAIKEIVESPEQLEKIKALGFEPRYMNAEELAAYAESEEARIKELLAKIPN